MLHNNEQAGKIIAMHSIEQSLKNSKTNSTTIKSFYKFEDGKHHRHLLPMVWFQFIATPTKTLL